MTCGDTLANEALSVALGHLELEELTDLRATQDKLREARLACPVLFADEGDLFSHRLDERMQSYDEDVFEYVGRTVKIDAVSAERVTPAGWLIFRHMSGAGISGNGIALNGGVRDVIGAWPIDKYHLYDHNGQFDRKVFCLPPEKCYCFRCVDVDSDDEDGCYLESDE